MPSSDWFTAPRVRRLLVVLAQIPRATPGVDQRTCLDGLRSSVDGPRSELPTLLEVLRDTGLLYEDLERYRQTTSGERLASMGPRRARTFLALTLIQSGLMHDQVRRLIEASTIRPDGSAAVRVGHLRRVAPQLLGLLAGWDDVVGATHVEVPGSLLAELDAPWSLIPLPRTDDGRKKAVGSRAEAYSYHFLRLGGATLPQLTWVALDDESLGYDIEDRSGGPLHRIEVKGSEQRPVRFFLSDNEHRVAHADPSRYSVHFWGEINLNRSPRDEYAFLRSKGFPIVFNDLAGHLVDGRLEATATKYRVVPGPTFGASYPDVLV